MLLIDHCGKTSTTAITEKSVSTSLCHYTHSFSGKSVIVCWRIEDYADYFLTENGMYFRMFGGTRAPSLLSKYATDYVIHKEAVRQVFLDGIGSFLFEHKKTAYPPLPFKLGSYRFTRVKQADEFVEELQGSTLARCPTTEMTPTVKLWNIVKKTRCILSIPTILIGKNLFSEMPQT